MMPLTWEVKETSQYGHIVHYGRCGEIVVFTVNYGLSRKEELRGKLPGFKADLGEFDTVEDAKARADKVFAAWLEKAGLVEKETAK